MQDNKFLELSSNPLMNLDHTKRYSGTKLVEEETLSQHIVDTIMMGLKIIDTVNHIGTIYLDPGKYVLKAIYHDLEEAVTGDIPRPLKYYNEDTLRSMRDVADQVAKQFFHSQFNDELAAYNLWDSAKEGAEGFILQIVDTLVVAHKVVKEVTLLNNYYMLRVAHEVTGYLREKLDIEYFSDESVNDYLSSLIMDAIEAMNDIMESHKDSLNSLNIFEQSMV